MSAPLVLGPLSVSLLRPAIGTCANCHQPLESHVTLAAGVALCPNTVFSECERQAVTGAAEQYVAVNPRILEPAQGKLC